MLDDKRLSLFVCVKFDESKPSPPRIRSRKKCHWHVCPLIREAGFTESVIIYTS